MPKFELFSERQKRKLNSGRPILFTFDTFPPNFRVQVIHILRDAMGNGLDYSGVSNSLWTKVRDTLRREFGVFQLPSEHSNPNWHSELECSNFFLQTQKYEDVLDFIEVSFKLVNGLVRTDIYSNFLDVQRAGISLSPDKAIEELNQRFRDWALGYKFEADEIIRVDSEFLNEQVIEPALTLLHDNNFKGAEEEFVRAHKHYLKGEFPEAINDALKSFESAIKTICTLKGWAYDPNAPASKLIETILSNNFLPSYMQSHLTSLRSLLENGLPTVRNKNSGHGQGNTSIEIPRSLATFALHLAGSNIVFLVETYKSAP